MVSEEEDFHRHLTSIPSLNGDDSESVARALMGIRPSALNNAAVATLIGALGSSGGPLI
jgi:hypothetical protein